MGQRQSGPERVGRRVWGADGQGPLEIFEGRSAMWRRHEEPLQVVVIKIWIGKSMESIERKGSLESERGKERVLPSDPPHDFCMLSCASLSNPTEPIPLFRSSEWFSNTEFTPSECPERAHYDPRVALRERERGNSLCLVVEGGEKVDCLWLCCYSIIKVELPLIWISE